MTTSRTFLFMPESAYGPTNNCIGIGHRAPRARAPRGVRRRAVVGGQARGARLRGGSRRPGASARARPDGVEPDAGQFWTDFIRDTAPEFRKPTIEQLSTFVQPTWQALIDGAKYCEPQLREIIDRARARRRDRGQRQLLPGAGHGRRAVRADDVVQPARDGAAPTCRRCSRATPSTTAPVGTSSAPSTTARIATMWNDYDEWVQVVRRAGARPTSTSSTPASTSTCTCTPRPSTTPTCGRSTPRGTGSTRRCAPPTSRSRCPTVCRDGEGALIYLSLGSLGSADVDLMRRLVDVLSRTPPSLHRVEGSAARAVRARRQHVGRPIRCRRPT